MTKNQRWQLAQLAKHARSVGDSNEKIRQILNFMRQHQC